jgi:hypothetical protein
MTCIKDVQCFLNVDLDIESAEDLTPLIDALSPYAITLDRPPGMATFELEDSSPTSPEPLIEEFVRLVKALPPDARALWEGASRRVFDIGIESVRGPAQEVHRLSPRTLRAAAAVGAEIALTIYGSHPTSRSERAN